MRLAQSARDSLAYDRMHLRVLPVAARFSRDGSTPEAKTWTDRIGEALGEFYSDWLPSWARPQQAAERLRIPQVDAFGFGEKLAIVEEASMSKGSMIPVYERIADLLTQSPPDAEKVLGLARSDTKPKPPAPRSRRAAPSRELDYEHDIFVSHAAGTVLDEWVDAFLELLRRELSKVLGHEPRIFFDLSQVRVDAAWDASVASSLQRSRLLLAIVTPKFMESPWCRAQWATFERRETETDRAPLIQPVLVRPAENLPEWIERRRMIDVTGLPRSGAALFKRGARTHAHVADVADKMARLLRDAPAFNPAWSVDTPDNIEPKRPPVADAGPSPLTLDAEGIAALLERGANPVALVAGRTLMKQLLRDGDFAQLAKLAGAVHRRVPSDVEATLNFARGLHKTGHASEAEKLLAPLVKSLQRSSPMYGEATYLLGDAYIEHFVSASPRTSRPGRSALSRAIQTYGRGFDADRQQHVWHGVRLVALLAAAQRCHIQTPTALKQRTLARALLKQFERIPTSLRTQGYHAGVAQLQIALGNWPLVEEHLRVYLATPDLSADDLKSVHRDLTELWDIEHDPRGAPLVAALRARVLRTAGGSVMIPTADLPIPSSADVSTVLEGRFGGIDTQSVRWMQTSLERVRSVGAVRSLAGRGYGTCFLVEARAVGLALDELVAITAAHVIGDREHSTLKASETQVVFEATDPPTVSEVVSVLWTSPTTRLDTTVLRLRIRPTGIKGLPLADSLPSLDEPTRVYLAGHPGGRELSISLQDNELLDHEGPPSGTPPTPDVVRLHYRAPTEAGSSGSPVFNQQWEVIGVHRRADDALPRLNGKPGTYGGSEAIWIQSIVAAINSK
jgi:hypothetical protein